MENLVKPMTIGLSIIAGLFLLYAIIGSFLLYDSELAAEVALANQYPATYGDQRIALQEMRSDNIGVVAGTFLMGLLAAAASLVAALVINLLHSTLLTNRKLIEIHSDK